MYSFKTDNCEGAPVEVIMEAPISLEEDVTYSFVTLIKYASAPTLLANNSLWQLYFVYDTPPTITWNGGYSDTQGYIKFGMFRNAAIDANSFKIKFYIGTNTKIQWQTLDFTLGTNSIYWLALVYQIRFNDDAYNTIDAVCHVSILDPDNVGKLLVSGGDTSFFLWSPSYTLGQKMRRSNNTTPNYVQLASPSWAATTQCEFQIYEPYMIEGGSIITDTFLEESTFKFSHMLFSGIRNLDYIYYDTELPSSKWLFPPYGIMDGSAYDRSAVLEDKIEDAMSEIEELQDTIDDIESNRLINISPGGIIYDVLDVFSYISDLGNDKWQHFANILTHPIEAFKTNIYRLFIEEYEEWLS